MDRLTYNLVVDTREGAVIEHLGAFPHKIEQLNVGDYRIDVAADEGSYPVMVIERKTLNDFGASIRDGRMENNEKLMWMHGMHKSRVIYLIEGQIPNDPETRYGGIRYVAIESCMTHLILRHGVSVVWVKDAKAAANWLIRQVASLRTFITKEFDNQMANNPLFANLVRRREQQEDQVEGGEDPVYVAPVDENAYLKKMWMCAGGVGHKAALSLAQNHAFIDILDADLTTWNISKAAQDGIKRFEVPRSEHLLAALCKINGITKERIGNTLVSHYGNLRAMCAATEEEIASVMIIGSTRRIGPVAAKKIHAALRAKIVN